MPMMNEELPDESAEISKSQKKREASAAQDLGEQLVELDPKILRGLALPESLFEAVVLAQSITARSGRKRQLQYIGKLMRHIELEPIKEGLNALTYGHQKQVEHQHLVEQWRDKLLNEGDDILAELITIYPSLDRQHIRQLIRQARKDALSGKSPKNKRLLFKYLSNIIQ